MPHLTIDEDSYERIVTCLRVLSEDDVVSREMFAGQCRSSFAMMMQQEQLKIAAAARKKGPTQLEEAFFTVRAPPYPPLPARRDRHRGGWRRRVTFGAASGRGGTLCKGRGCALCT